MKWLIIPFLLYKQSHSCGYFRLNFVLVHVTPSALSCKHSYIRIHTRDKTFLPQSLLSFVSLPASRNGEPVFPLSSVVKGVGLEPACLVCLVYQCSGNVFPRNTLHSVDI
uniref:Uncharacterized protein n=1 Tax=Anguilla anguilla TaxID=7936 RepID=A0A0E9XMK0_ANGAN